MDPTQIVFRGFGWVFFRRPKGSIFGQERGKRILEREILELPPMSALQKTWKIACVGSGKVSPGNSAKQHSALPVLTISIYHFRKRHAFSPRRQELRGPTWKGCLQLGISGKLQ